MTRPPCIVCGARPHDGAEHERHRVERRRAVNLLRKQWPRLKGVEPTTQVRYSARTEWEVKVLRGGAVVHRPVEVGT